MFGRTPPARPRASTPSLTAATEPLCPVQAENVTADVIPDFLKETDIEALFKACKSAEERFLIVALFDTGARATEFHNIRYEDIQLPEGSNAYAKITLKEEYSKTKGRAVSLYWKHSLETVWDYIRQREADGIRADEPIFKRAYTASRLLKNCQ